MNTAIFQFYYNAKLYNRHNINFYSDKLIYFRIWGNTKLYYTSNMHIKSEAEKGLSNVFPQYMNFRLGAGTHGLLP